MYAIEELSAPLVNIKPITDLIGGGSFVVPLTIRRDGVAIQLKALVDTGAQAWLLADRSVCNAINKAWSLPRTTYERPVTIKGFENRPVQVIDSSISADLQIRGRSFTNQPLLETDLGQRPEFQVIIGLRFLANYKLNLDCQRKRLLFPQTLPYNHIFQRDILVPIRNLLPAKNAKAQASMERRDALWNAANTNALFTIAHVAPVSILQRNKPAIAPRDSWTIEYRQSLQKMKKALQCTIDAVPSAPLKNPMTANPPIRFLKPPGVRNAIPTSDITFLKHDHITPVVRPRSAYQSPNPRKTYYHKTLGLDLCILSLDSFARNLRRPKGHRHKAFDECSFSMLSLDRLLEESLQHEDPASLEEIKARLPRQYAAFADVFSKHDSDQLAPHRPIDHKIELLPDAAPLRSHPLYSMSSEQLLVLRDYLRDNLRKEFIVPSSASYGAPVLFAKKPNGGLRFCVDYREINARTRKDVYPLPLIQETLSRLSTAKLFTKLDIRQAFHRIRIHPDSTEYTSFRTRYGQYKYQVLPFGLTNGPSTFQRYINDTLFPLSDFCTAYIDDILIYSNNPLEHEAHVKQVLDKLRSAGLQADIRKSEFSVTRTKFLGYIISTDGIEVDPTKITAVSDWEPPRKVKELQSFLGFCNFYRQFIDAYSRIARPLHSLVAALEWEWTGEHQQAFDQLKTALTTAPVLVHFQEHRPTKLETDAFDGMISRALSQLANNDE